MRLLLYIKGIITAQAGGRYFLSEFSLLGHALPAYIRALSTEGLLMQDFLMKRLLFCSRAWFGLMIAPCLLLILLGGIEGCDGGLDPAMTASQKASIGGTIQYKGGAASFPPKDSVLFLTVVGFKDIPRDTNVLNIISQGEAYFLNTSLPYGKDTSYTLEIPTAPVTLKYICVAQQYSSNFFSDWRVIGIYSLTNDFSPTPLSMIAGQIRNNVNMIVDFKNIPPQPFKR